MRSRNAFDDPLDSVVVAYGEPRPTTVPESENGDYAMLAMGAGDGADGTVYARARGLPMHALRQRKTVSKNTRHPSVPSVPMCVTRRVPHAF